MNVGIKSRIIPIALLFALLFAALSPITALADDNLPPTPDAPAVTDAPAVDSAPADAAPSASDAAADPVVEATPSVPEILDAAPEGTNLVVTDADGQPLPLATEAAANALATGDPMWCPDGVLPGGAGCTASHSGFNASGYDPVTGTWADIGLAWDLQGNASIYNGSGTIYVEQGTVADTSEIWVSYPLLGLTNLVVQGGWNFSNNQVEGTSTFDLGDGNLLGFLDWGEGAPGTTLTLKDIVVNGGGLAIGNAGDTSHIPAANVLLDNVTVSGTDLGTWVITTGNVTVTNSHFNSTATTAGDDPKSGLRIDSGGDVSLNNVTADNNHGNGLEVYGYGDYDGPGAYHDPTGQVTISNSSFNNNTVTAGPGSELEYDECCWAWGWGFVEGSGTVNGDHLATTISNVSSSGNSRGTTVFSSGDMTITNSHFDDTYEPSPASLTVWSGGVVTLQNITASNNGGDGVDIFGPWNGGDPSDPENGSPSHVDIVDSVFNNNDGSMFGYDATDGVFIVMGSGGATVSGSIFFNNTGYGFEGAGSGTLVDTGNTFGGNRLGNAHLAGDDGTLLSTALTIGQLPGALPAGYSFVAGMDVLAAAAGTQLSFDMPAGTAGTPKVLEWSGTQWVEVPFTVVGGKVYFTPTGAGAFVLVVG